MRQARTNQLILMNTPRLHPNLHRDDFTREVRAMNERQPIIQDMTFDRRFEKTLNNIMRGSGRELTGGNIHICDLTNPVRISISILTFKGNTLF
ncbi:Unannotated [Lentimonas sp. CC4]|nr:Unannotated [Lentimonas sp. CC4]